MSSNNNLNKIGSKAFLLTIDFHTNLDMVDIYLVFLFPPIKILKFQIVHSFRSYFPCMPSKAPYNTMFWNDVFRNIELFHQVEKSISN